MFQETIDFIRNLYGKKEFVPLHEPYFNGNEKQYLIDCIDSTFVSSVGKYVDRFEKMIVDYTGANYAVATVNGTSALHIAMILAGVKNDDEVITQPLTFVATCNAISYIGAKPVFVDVDRDTMGLSPEKLEMFLKQNTIQDGGYCKNRLTKRIIRAMVPMHTFGHPARLKELAELAHNYNITLIEDAAESLGSYYHGKHTGLVGSIGILSFNGNKTITTGGGGMIITNDRDFAKRAKHITTTAKVPHKWEFEHDEMGFNYRLPNLNAALGCAQMELLPEIIQDKRKTAQLYRDYFDGTEQIKLIWEPLGCASNFWLNSVLLENRQKRDEFLEVTNSKGIMTRPIWKLMNSLTMFKDVQCGDLENANWLENRVVNIPSSVR